MIARAGAGLLIAVVIASTAYAAGALSRSGAIAAMVVGAICVAAGWSWGAVLIIFFISSSALSRLGADVKARRISSVVAKGGERDAVQVLANGGLFTLSAALTLLAPWPGWRMMGAGALAAAAADTWGTEVGTLVGRRPRLLTSLRPVGVGTSGGVTAPGLLALVAGALFIAIVASLLRWPAGVLGWAFAGGVAGALADSLMGAWWQARRWCPRCNAGTERMVHACGTATVPAGGVAWLDNDTVNLLATAVGAAVALLGVL
ncbi:MAG TPA: DUF92 domain-containing protein [Gemmatimonadaceae bacterium]|nr:DUF92 domain-containing protein [Gemmatimonadaceae bacterium]